MLSRVLNPLLQNHILARVVDFFIAGHIYYNTVRGRPSQLLDSQFGLTCLERNH